MQSMARRIGISCKYSCITRLLSGSFKLAMAFRMDWWTLMSYSMGKWLYVNVFLSSWSSALENSPTSLAILRIASSVEAAIVSSSAGTEPTRGFTALRVLKIAS